MSNEIQKVDKKQQKEKIKQAIDLLNDIIKVKLAPSSIHGVGVFAIRDLKKGEKMYMDATFQAFDIPYKDFKKLRPEIANQILERWPNIVNGSHFLYPDTRMSAFMNHSDVPNFDGKEDKMLKAVKAGQEILEDYRKVENYQKVYDWLD